jgi:hypothetical protein
MKINLCCVKLNKCGLFSDKHNGMASVQIIIQIADLHFKIYTTGRALISHVDIQQTYMHRNSLVSM